MGSDADAICPEEMLEVKIVCDVVRVLSAKCLKSFLLHDRNSVSAELIKFIFIFWFASITSWTLNTEVKKE